MLEFIYQLFKNVTVNESIAICSPVLIYWFVSNKTNNREKLLRCTSFIINAFWIVSFIKGILQIPLPAYPNTFALPSGHTYMKMAVFGCLALELIENRYLAYSIAINIGFLEGLRTIYYGYHSVMDVLAAVAICLIQFILFYELVFKKYKNSKIFLNFITVVGSIICSLTVVFMKYHAPTYRLDGLYKLSIYTIVIILTINLREYLPKLLHKK